MTNTCNCLVIVSSLYELTPDNCRIYTFSFIYTSSFIPRASSFILVRHSHPSSLYFIFHPRTAYYGRLHKDDNHLKVHLVSQNVIPRDISPDYQFTSPQTFPPSKGSSCDPTPISKRSSINCVPIVLQSCRNLSNSDFGSL